MHYIIRKDTATDKKYIALKSGDYMSDFMEKFNIFDIFTMLIPGVVFWCSIGVVLSLNECEWWKRLGNQRYVYFLVASYVIGIVLQEIGTIFDKLFLHKLLYGGQQRKTFLTKENWKKSFSNECMYKIGKEIKKSVIKQMGHRNVAEEEINLFVFSYCVNYLEKRNLNSKVDKMLILSEMSRSFMYICLIIFGVLEYKIFFGEGYWGYRIAKVVTLIFFCIFLLRKYRYEKYRLEIMIRLVWSCMENR